MKTSVINLRRHETRIESMFFTICHNTYAIVLPLHFSASSQKILIDFCHQYEVCIICYKAKQYEGLPNSLITHQPEQINITYRNSISVCSLMNKTFTIIKVLSHN